MRADKIKIGQIINEPDSRGYVVRSIRAGRPIPGYITFWLQNQLDTSDRLLHSVPSNAEIGVIGP